ncbi:MAG: alkaline phosphatase D family protein, partial [Egibacteraceae bacterium]
GQYRYNVMDEHVRRFNARVPVFAQWDDHEVTNNWWPGRILDDDRYTVREVDLTVRDVCQRCGQESSCGQDSSRMRDESWPQGRTPPKRQRYFDPGP